MLSTYLFALYLDDLTHKSVYMRIGPRQNASCLPISLSNDVNFNGLTKSGTFAYLLCVLVSLSVHWIMLKSFHRTANAIFGKVGRIASEEVTLQLIKSKCLPVLFYG